MQDCTQESVKPTPVADAIVAALNELLKVDPVAATRLIEFKTSCNYKCAIHPMIVVRVLDESSTAYDLSVIGALQTAVAAEGKRLAYSYEETTGCLKGFQAVDIAAVSVPNGDVT